LFKYIIPFFKYALKVALGSLIISICNPRFENELLIASKYTSIEPSGKLYPELVILSKSFSDILVSFVV
jgi:hypothetical protein